MSVSAGANFTSSCGDGQLVTDYAQHPHGAEIVLADRQKDACYLLGPTLLTATNVGSADAVDAGSGRWVVDVHFTNDDFVTKVVRGNVYKPIAFILDGVVQSTPTIEPGVTSRDISITGGYDEATAHEVATRIGPSSRSHTSDTTP